MRMLWAVACLYMALHNLETMIEPGREGWKAALDGGAMIGWLTAGVAAIFAKRWLA